LRTATWSSKRGPGNQGNKREIRRYKKILSFRTLHLKALGPYDDLFSLYYDEWEEGTVIDFTGSSQALDSGNQKGVDKVGINLKYGLIEG
jgi:hypothetical protein